MPVKILEDRYVTLPVQASQSLINTEIVMNEDVEAPIELGQVLGRVEIYEGSSLIGEVPIIATLEIEEGMFLSRFGVEDSITKKVIKYLTIAGGIVGFLIFVFIILIIRAKIGRKARRRARALQIAMEREAKLREMELRRWPY